MADQTVESFCSEGSVIVYGKLNPGDDLLAGMHRICRNNGVKYGVVISCIGSLREIVYTYPLLKSSDSFEVGYREPTCASGCFEMIGCQGTIGENTEGEFDCHLHGIFVNENEKITSGHLLPGCKVFITMEIAIASVENAKLIRGLDPETNFPIFKIYKNASEKID